MNSTTNKGGAQCPANVDASEHDLPEEVQRTIGGEVILWARPIRSPLRPIATFGRFKNGAGAVNLRMYRVFPDGSAAMTQEGATFRIDEFAEVVNRLRAVFPAFSAALNVRTESQGRPSRNPWTGPCE